MASLPLEPEAFTEQVAEMVGRRLSRSEIAVTGPLELTIDERRVELLSLYRRVHQGEEEARQLVEEFVDAYLDARRLEETPIPFELARARVLPRIQPSAFFRDRRPDFYAHQPFINDTVILYMIDLNGTVTAVTTEQLIRWGVSVEDLDQLARRNLAATDPEAELTVFHGEEGAAALFNVGDGYDASRLLLNQLHQKLAPELGGNFLVAIPTRDTFLAFPTEPGPFVDRVKHRITRDYRKLPYPITDDLFLVTHDGVAPGDAAA